LQIFQLDGRFENIEYLLNNVIGPRSYLQTTKAEQIADDLTTAARSFINQVTEKDSTTQDRSKRSPKKEVQEKAEAASKVMYLQVYKIVYSPQLHFL